MPMLTADGTLPRALAAAENEPRSSTARNNWMLSLEKFMGCLSIDSDLSKNLKASDFFCQTY